MVQNPPRASDIPTNPSLNTQTSSSIIAPEPIHYPPPPQPHVNAYIYEPSGNKAEYSNASTLDQTNKTQPTTFRADAEDTHQGLTSPQLPVPSDPTLISQQNTTSQAIEQISDGLVNLNLQATASSRSTPLGPEDEDFHEWKRPIPPVTDDGEPNGAIWECPDQRELDYDADWYHLASVPDFLICTRCHEMYLSGTHFAASLKRVRRAAGRCRFNVPRITRLLLPEYVKHNDDGPIREFMSSRLSILDCKGQQGSKGGAGIKWFKTLDSRLEGFVSCEACYEDIVLATSFRQNFVAHDVAQPLDATWACDVCLPFIARSLIKYSKRTVNAWEEWVQAAAKHINLPRCEKKSVSPTSRRWMQLRQQKFTDLKICERCYEETVALTCLSENFEVFPQEPSATGLDWMDVALGYRTVEPSPLLCSATSFPVYVSIAAAKSQKNIGVFYKALETIIPSPHCTEQGIIGGTWYTLRGGGCDSYNLCAACYAAFVGTWQLDRFYQQVKGQDSTQAVLCSFQRSAPRWFQHMYRMQEAVETGVWSRYADFVRKFDGVPDCAKETQVENRKWYGWDDCTICPECYVTFCKESSPAPGVQMDYDNHLVTDRRMCCMYSPRMRQKWTEACEKGNAEELVEFSRLRHGVYVQTVLQVRMLRQMQELQMMNAMHAGMMSITYQGIESMRVVSGTTDGYEHGNSTLGWHATEEGATSAAFRNQMQSGMSQSNSASTWMMIAQLTAKWQEVE
ncbi:integral membrane protein [Colletotrichum incanum]|nr:integral membrane protein [Colletotrichum incanum]